MEMKQRDYSLDFIKIVATIIIVFHHYQQITGAFFEGGINFWNSSFYYGNIVELFFVISGYFMFTYIEKIRSGLSFPKFYLKRLSRFMPLLTLGAVAYEGLLIAHQLVCNEVWFNETTKFWGTIIACFGIQEGWMFPNPMVNNPTWYVSVLMLCYVVFYMLVFTAKQKDIPVEYLFIAAILCGIGILTYKINLPFLNPQSARGYYSFFFGVLLARMLRGGERLNGKWTIGSFAVITIITLLIIYKNRLMSDGTHYTMTYLYYPALIIFCKSDAVRRVLNHKILGKLGEISFDVFIWHNPLLILMYIVMKAFRWELNLDCYAAMIGFTVFCYLWGTMSHYLYEKPMKKWIEESFFAK